MYIVIRIREITLFPSYAASILRNPDAFVYICMCYINRKEGDTKFFVYNIYVVNYC